MIKSEKFLKIYFKFLCYFEKDKISILKAQYLRHGLFG